jgi:capsular polysaccharide biosynthesis protein
MHRRDSNPGPGEFGSAGRETTTQRRVCLMNLTEALQTLRKRWLLTSLLLILVLAATAAAVVKLPKTYQTSSTVAFLPSQSSAKAFGNNPYLDFDSSLNIAADVVGRRMMDPAITSALSAQGYSSTYQVEDAPNAPGPVLLVLVTGHGKAEVQHTLGGVTNAIGTQLAAMQSGISQRDRITELVLAVSAKPTLLRSKLERPIAGVLVLGLALALGIPLIVEGISARRRSRKGTDITSGPTLASDLSPAYRSFATRARYSSAATGFKGRNGKSS